MGVVRRLFQSDPLADLARRINESEARIERLKRTAVEEAIAQGHLLAQAKAMLPHGQFTPWLQANCHVSPVQARKYLRLAASTAALPPSELAMLSDMGLEAAVKQVAPPKAAKARQERPKASTKPRAKPAATPRSEPLAGVSDEELVAELIRRLEARAVKLTKPRLQWLKSCLAE